MLSANALDVNGSLAVGTYAGTASGPSNSLIVSGQVGIGATVPVAGLDVQRSVTSSSGAAFGVREQQALTASANNDVLTGLYINPSFTNGGYTGVADNGLIVANGNVGIGTAYPQALLDVNGDIRAQVYFHSSDARLKENIKTSQGLAIVSKLRGVTFTWKNNKQKSSGVIAQEVEKVLPNAVRADGNNMKAVEYDQLFAPLIEAVKELKVDNDDLRAEFAAYKAAHP